MAATKGKMCVIGAGGFIGSWVVQVLLSNNYIVHGTIRDPSDEKYAHLQKLEKAENLKLFKAGLLDYDALYSAIEGCIGVFHIASPVPTGVVTDPEAILEPAIKGTLNVLRASNEAKVRRVVLMSTAGAVWVIPNLSDSQVMTESCWSDKEYCRSTENWYCLSKTEAESQAFEYAKQTGLDLVSFCPPFVLGPLLQSTVNVSTMALLNLFKGSETVDWLWCIVDVRDLAAATLMAFEKPEAEGRYISGAHTISAKDLVEKLRTLYPNYSYPKSFTEFPGGTPMLCSEKLNKLGWSRRSLEETLMDTVESFRKAGHLD